MRLDKFDLNLLVGLDALLEEQSVTRTAERLGLTQSGVSAALARLRVAFQDDLLVQHGKRMIPTPHAQALKPEIKRTIADLRALISRTSRFDPATSTRRFRIAASDYLSTVLLAPLASRFSRIAPDIRLDITLPSAANISKMANGDLDLLLSPMQFMHADHPSEFLLTERHVAVGWNENQLFARPLTEDAFYTASHVGVAISGQDTFFESFLKKGGRERNIELFAPSFLQAPFMLPGTNRICVMHERLALMLADQLPLAVCDLPFDVPNMDECIQYHDARRADPGLVWIKGELHAMARQLAAN